MKYQEPDIEIILLDDDTLLTLVEVSSTGGVDINGIEIDI